MSAEDTLRKRVAGLLRRWRCGEGSGSAIMCEELFVTIGIPLDVLSWVSANPEAAKGLAEGKWQAVPKRANFKMKMAGGKHLNTRHTIEWMDQATRQDMKAPAVCDELWADMLAASTPAPSGKAQSIPFGSDDPNAPDGVF